MELFFFVSGKKKFLLEDLGRVADSPCSLMPKHEGMANRIRRNREVTKGNGK